MNGGEITLWNSGVWLIPVILLATVVGLFFLVRYWKNKTQQNLKYFRSELRHFQNNRSQLAMAVRQHSAEDPEPYGSRMAALDAQLDAIGGQITAMEEQHVSIQQRVRRLSANRWQATIGAPVFWYFLRQEVAQLWKDLAASRAALAAADEFGQSITSLGWEIAQQARQVGELQQQVKSLLEQLQDKNLHGDGIEAAIRQERQVRQELEQIPRYFLSGDETAVLEQADKASIAQVHDLVDETRPLLEQSLSQLQAWERQYAETVSKVTRMRQLLGSVGQTLDEMPTGLDLIPLRSRFNQLSIISQNLHATLARMEVESMDAVTEEAVRVHQAAQEMGGQLKQARQKFASLEKVSTEISDGVRQTAALMADLGKGTPHPVIWDQSSARLNELRQRANAFGAAGKTLQVEQVDQDLAAAGELNRQVNELARHSQQVAQQHAELLALLSGPELSQGIAWYREASEVAEQVEGYDPDNWLQTDRVTALPGELDAFAEGLRLIVTPGQPKPLHEAEVSQRLDEARQLSQFAVRLRSRLENVQRRLVEVQQAEKLAREQLEGAHNSLNQIGLLVRSNDFLAEIAAQELSRLQSSLRQLNGELEQAQRGAIDKKVKAVSSLLAKAEQAGNTWLEQLEQEIRAQRKVLSDQLTELEKIATVDEPAVAQARSLLSEGQAFSAGGYGQKHRYRLEEILGELKRRCDYWQSCNASIRAVADVQKPLLEVHQSVNEYREFAKGQLDDLAGWMRSTRGWPPTSISIKEESQELSRLEEQWQAIKRQPSKAITLVAQMGNLLARYQAAAERARQIAERAAQEQKQVEKLETELDELAQLWQTQWNSYRENPHATEDIRKLLAEIAGEREQLKRQYRQGAQNFSQVLQSLQMLHRKARTAQVAIDENHLIDVNGRVIAYR